MKTKILTIAALIFMVLNLQAQPGFNPGIRTSPEMRGQVQMRNRMEALKKSLNLTDDQKEAIKKIRLTMSKEMTPLRNILGESMAHLKTLTSADKPDMAGINQSLEKIGDQRTEIAKAAMKYRLQLRSVFTEEQLMKLHAIEGRIKQLKQHGNEKKIFNSMINF
jgi:Spy/CpxP family protein refolding chaperone